MEEEIVKYIVAGLVASLVIAGAVAIAADKEKPVYKVTADEIAKEFKDDAAAAKKKYGADPKPEIEITGTALLEIGPAKDAELLLENDAKVTIRLGVKANRPPKYPAKFTATATYKGYFDMAKELSLTATKITYK
jgi:hypothetical protein